MTIDTAKLKAAAAHRDLLGVQKHANQHRLSRLVMEVHNDELRIIAAAVESYTDELIAALEVARADCREYAARIAELEEAKSLHDEGVSMLCGQFDELAAATGWTTEIAMSQGVGQLEYARSLKARIAELEARTVKLPSINPQMFNDDVMFGYRKAQREAVEFCAAAGINLETGGEA